MMDAPQRRSEDAQYNDQFAEDDDGLSPLLTPMSTLSVGTLCTVVVVAVLAICWCVLDYWNRAICHDLFGIGNVRTEVWTRSGIPEIVAPFGNFSYPLTLAFLQFFFMGIFFLAFHMSVNQARFEDLRIAKLAGDKRWPGMVLTHVFSTFWLQALMMPAQMLSISLYAASRAVEIPIAAALRSQILGPRYGRKSAATVGLAFASAAIMFFAYGQLSGCVCIWSGTGVALSGLTFYLVSLLLLAMPAANAVCQEAIMLEPGMHPLLLLALQNIFACLIFGPTLVLCHLMGFEDVTGAFAMILSYSEVGMMVIWLCAQMAATSLLCITLIHLVDSFWMITLRAVRILLWAMSIVFFAGLGMPVSISCPRTSLWAFVIVLGALLGVTSTVYDKIVIPEESADTKDVPEKASATNPAAP